MLAAVLGACLIPSASSAQQPKPGAAASAAANDIAHFFSQVGDQIDEDCIFELSDEQVEVQGALIQAYTKAGASSAVARRLAVKQIHPPKLSDKCKKIKSSEKSTGKEPGKEPGKGPGKEPGKDKTAALKPDDLPWATTSKSVVVKKPTAEAAKPAPEPVEQIDPAIALADKKPLAQWDCASNVDFVTIKHKGFPRKLTGGEICNPFKDVVAEVPESAKPFKLGYTIKTGRLFVISDEPAVTGKTIAWAISGRDVCRNDPDPACLAARAVGPLPPGEYSFSGDKEQRVSWGPKTKRNVAGIWLRKLWNKEQFTPQQVAAILSRGNIAIHVRLKGEMSEACLGLEPKGWNYVAGLIKDGRATGVLVYIDEPYPQIAEAPPVLVASSFSLTSLFNN
jgi:hypothetical protein